MRPIYALAVGCALLAAAPAHADDVTRVALGETISSLVAAPDGGAWIGIERPGSHDAVGRALADGTFSTRVAAGKLDGGALGPDGQAWFTLLPNRLLREDGMVVGPIAPEFNDVGVSVATGPDGNLWNFTTAGLMSVPPAGQATLVKLGRFPCEPSSNSLLARAADRALWIAEPTCPGVVRIGPDGKQTFLSLGTDGAAGFAPDATGGMWFVSAGERFGGHIDPGGTVSYVGAPGLAFDVAVAPDGSAWFAIGRCELARVGPEGIRYLPTPIAATQIAFDPAGGLWLASAARLVHTSAGALAGPCDDRVPSLSVSGGSLERISLVRLRHDRGLGITVREPVFLIADVGIDLGFGADYLKTFNEAVPAGTRRYPLSARRLSQMERAVKAGRNVSITVFAQAADRDGNRNIGDFHVKVTR